jgi:hypothetical protein
MSNCGFPEKDQFAVLRLACERDIRNNQAEIIAEIYRSQGPLLTSEDPELQPVIGRYKDLLKLAGKEIVMNGKIPDDLKAELDKPLIPEDEYSKSVNEAW